MITYIFKCDVCGRVKKLTCDSILGYEQRKQMRCGECGGRISLIDILN